MVPNIDQKLPILAYAKANCRNGKQNLSDQVYLMVTYSDTHGYKAPLKQLHKSYGMDFLCHELLKAQKTQHICST